MAASSMVEADPNALCSWVTRTRGDVPPPLVVRPFTLRRPLFSLENVRLLLPRLGKQAELELQDIFCCSCLSSRAYTGLHRPGCCPPRQAGPEARACLRLRGG